MTTSTLDHLSSARPLSTHQAALLEWYRANARPLPWRRNRDPYHVWLSETMLQQTTSAAVIPYFERFLEHFPKLEDLAHAPIEKILELWSGLGYYSRARNLHRAAQILVSRGDSFPASYQDLLALPGFGPYTARAVASIAFGEAVGVVDGNTIRVHSRFRAQPWPWWNNKTRQDIQMQADAWVQGQPSHEINQALMELGATICTPTNPSCLICPLRPGCQAFQHGRAAELPLKKPRRPREIWLWSVEISEHRQKLMLMRNLRWPFLQNQWIWPGRARRVKRKPKHFAYKHVVTHHDIYVTVRSTSAKLRVIPNHQPLWVQPKDLPRYAPHSLVLKAYECHRLASRTQHPVRQQTKKHRAPAIARRNSRRDSATASVSTHK